MSLRVIFIVSHPFSDKEQFDEALDRRVWSLSDQRRTWNVEIAKKRRTTPQEVEKLMKNLVACQRDVDTTSVQIPDADIDSDMEEGGAVVSLQDLLH